MDIIQTILLLLLAVAAFFFYKKQQQPQTPNLQIQKLESQLTQEKLEKEKTQEKAKLLYAENVNLKADLKNLQHNNNELQKELSKHKAEQEHKQQLFEQKINKLDASKQILEKEKERITQLDQARQQQKIAKRDSMWAAHEQNTIAKLIELTNSSQYFFNSFQNTNLPEDFDAKLKPDFMIEFLDQYLIFDAKSSRSENLNTYIQDQVKKTTTKIKNNQKIYPLIFFIVPADAISDIKTHHYYEQGFTYFIISQESLAPVLFSLKKITSYEFADQLTPHDREAVVSVIAEFYQNINFNNAAHLLLTEMGRQSLEKISTIKPEIKEEVEQKRQKMRLNNLKPSDLKNLMASPRTQHQTIKEYTNPKIDVKNSDLNIARQLLVDEKEQ